MPENTNKTKNPERPAEAVKDLAQQGAVYGKDMFERSRAAAEETGQALQQSYSTVAKGAADFHGQWIQMVLANTHSNFDFGRQLLSVKSPSEFLELSAAHARKQFETFAGQAQHLTALAQKVTTDAVQPLQVGVKSAFNKPA